MNKIKKLLLLMIIFTIIGCGNIPPTISNLTDFKGYQVKSVKQWYKGNYTSFTAYRNGHFKNGVIPIRTTRIDVVQKLIDNIKE